MLNSKKILLLLISMVILCQSNRIFAQENKQIITFSKPNSIAEITLGETKKNNLFKVIIKTKDTIKVDAHFKVELANTTSTEQKEFKILTPTIYIPKNTVQKEFEIIVAFQSRTEEKSPSIIELKLTNKRINL